MIVVGVLAVVIGGVWIGQGLNLIPDSFMTGDKKWFVIGTIVAVIGIILLALGIRRRVTPPLAG